ncbi:hypothetical protein QYF36_009579 [Acer negundo]|nr:hypothetical protein QYF36_009579 [Acer negundo]
MPKGSNSLADSLTKIGSSRSGERLEWGPGGPPRWLNRPSPSPLSRRAVPGPGFTARRPGHQACGPLAGGLWRLGTVLDWPCAQARPPSP